MNKNDLIENNTNDELADMVIKLQQKFENSQSEINYRQKRIEELTIENEILRSKLMYTENALKTPMDDGLEIENIKLNNTIDILLERLKGKSE